MCTLIVTFAPRTLTPLVVAANRDEALDRPASSPFRWPAEAFVAPRDELAGGTWLGLTTSGLFVGVTNRFPSEKHPERESRGTLVVEALRAPSARALHASLATLSPTRFNAFHLLYADAEAAFITWSDGAALTHLALSPGRHVVTERSFGGDEASRLAAIDSGYPEPATPEALQALLGTPGVCVHAPAFNYGTRSSLVLFRRDVLAESRWFWADGAPDTTAFAEDPALVKALASP